MKCIDRKTRRSYSFEGHTLEVSEFMGSLNVREPLLEYLNSFFFKQKWMRDEHIYLARIGFQPKGGKVLTSLKWKTFMRIQRLHSLITGLKITHVN